MGECFITRRGGGKVGLKSISVTTPPNKTTYVAGETFDPTGMVVTADIGGFAIEASGYAVNPTEMTPGVTEVTISYEFAGVTKTTTQPVTVKTLSSIAITTQPAKRAYKFGEVFDRAGMVVTATYSDSSMADVTAQTTHSPTGALTHSDTTVTVSHTVGGTTKTATTTITIAKVLSGIAITTPPTTTAYIAGQTISTAGMVVTATYSDGSTANVTSACAISPQTASGSGFTVSYAYGGVTKTAFQSLSVTTPSATLNSNSWETIGLVASAGMASQYWTIGDEKTIALNGTNYTVQIVGIDHDNLSASDPRYGTEYNGGTNKAAITFALKECFATTYRMNSSDTNTGGWNATEMRTTTLATTFYGYLETALKNVLRTVNKLAAQSGGSSTILTSADKLWLFSEIEVFGSASNSKAGEGSLYGYWSAGNSRIKYRSGSAAWWWLRSPSSGYSTYFLSVDSNGYVSNSIGASYAGGSVAFGFCV